MSDFASKQLAQVREAVAELETELSRIIELDTVPSDVREKLIAQLAELKRKAGIAS